MTPLRILLDENLDEAFAEHLGGFQVQTVRQCGWSGLINGELLDRAQARFDVFVTADKNLPHQTNIGIRNIAVAVLDVVDLQLESAVSCLPALLAGIGLIEKGSHRLIRPQPPSNQPK